MVGLAEEGMTMIVVTHEIGFAREVAKPRHSSWTRARSSSRNVPEKVLRQPAARSARRCSCNADPALIPGGIFAGNRAPGADPGAGAIMG